MSRDRGEDYPGAQSDNQGDNIKIEKSLFLTFFHFPIKSFFERRENPNPPQVFKNLGGFGSPPLSLWGRATS